MIDKLASNTVVSVVRMHRDLFNVSPPVNDGDQQIGDWAIGGVREDPRPASTLKPAKDLDRWGRIIGHQVHAQTTKRVAGRPLDVPENWQVFSDGSANHPDCLPARLLPAESFAGHSTIRRWPFPVALRSYRPDRLRCRRVIDDRACR